MPTNRFQKTGSALPAGTRRPARWLPSEPEAPQPIRKVVDITRLPPPGAMRKPAFPAPPSSANVATAAAPASSGIAGKAVGGFTLGLFGFYVYMHTSLFGETMAVYAHLKIPMVAAMAVVISLTALFHGGLGRFNETPLARPWVLFAGWMCLASVFSFYVTGSVSYIVPFTLRIMAMPFLFCAFATTPRAVRTLISWCAVGIVPVLVLCALKGTMQGGIRFGIPETSMENPNDLAFHLLWGSCLMVSWLVRPGKIGKIIAFSTIPTCVWFLMKTASRSNFVSVFVLLAVLFLLVPGKFRIVLAVVVPLSLVITVAALPKGTQERILAIVISSQADVAAESAESASAGDSNLQGALSSEAERMELSKLAVEATMRHPIFGVGPTMFVNETAAFILEKTGKKAPWLTAHDSYLKISSETGIPGLIIYLWVIIAGLAANYRVYRNTEGKPGQTIASRNALCILLAFVTYAFGTFFSDLVYLPYLPITMGLTAANLLAARTEAKQLEQDRLNAPLYA